MLHFIATPWTWVFVALLALLAPVICGMYAIRYRRMLRLPPEGRDDDRVSCLSGWSGGAYIAAVVAVFTLPLHLVWVSIPIAVLVLLLYFPTAYMIERRVARELLANHRPRLTGDAGGGE